ncbi:WD40 repeat domain-containing protein, partial [Streptomyces sp. NPDC008240]|uniref:WD40 repeat domain-containing protein n=1 Tax=Streptomyces sp. NPDC008240 TaxID=3364822 RepID=UPI0036E22B1E
MAGNGGNGEGSYAVTLRELGEALTELKRERGAPSYDRILVRGKKVCGEQSAMSKASMSEVFAGRRGPASLDRLLWLARALLSYDDGEEVKPPERRDPQLQVWKDRWHTLESVRAVARRASSTEDTEKVHTADRDPAETSSRLEGIEPDDTPLRFTRHRRRSPFEIVAALSAPASTTAAGDNSTATRPEAAPSPQMVIPTQQLQAPPQPNASLAAPRLPGFASVGSPLTGDVGTVSAVAFSPDGRVLAIVSGNVVRLWDPIKRVSAGAPLSGSSEVTFWPVAFSPDWNLVATGNGNVVRLWDAAQRTPVGDLTGDAEDVNAVAFSLDGHLLATGGLDGTVRLWDAARRTPVGDPLTGHTGMVYSVAFSPDGR